MSKDTFNTHRVNLKSGLALGYEDQGYKIRGEVFWRLDDETTGSHTEGHINNIVTLDAGLLIARLMKSTATPNVSEPKFGIYAIAVGTGDVGWNPMNPPPANVNQRSLFNEIARKAVASTSFIDKNGAISGVPTNVVDFTFSFSVSEAVGPLTEMGLVGGDLSTNMSIRNPVLPPNGLYDPTVNTVGKDTLSNYLTFPVINKPSTSTLNLTYRLTF
jgi:hypothetical protein